MPRRIPSLQPLAQTVQSGEENTLGEVQLIKLVSYFPFQVLGNRDLAIDFGTAFCLAAQPIVQLGGGTRHERKKRYLIHNSLIQRRRLEEENKISLLVAIRSPYSYPSPNIKMSPLLD